MAVDLTVAVATNRFLRDGGLFALPLQRMREAGIIPAEGTTPYQEYPKIIRLNPREVEVKRMVELCDKSTVSDTTTKTIYDEYTVNSEDEEERVLSGGKTSAQIEEERQGLLGRCSNMNIAADPSWSVVRLRRLLGDALDAPAPNPMAKLEAELASLRKMATMQAEIDALRAQLGKPAAAEDDIEELRGELHALGVEVDMRWSVKTLRAKLDQATAPHEEAA